MAFWLTSRRFMFAQRRSVSSLRGGKDRRVSIVQRTSMEELRYPGSNEEQFFRGRFLRYDRVRLLEHGFGAAADRTARRRRQTRDARAASLFQYTDKSLRDHRLPAQAKQDQIGNTRLCRTGQSIAE